MRPKTAYKLLILLPLVLLLSGPLCFAQEEDAAPVPVIKLQYFNQNNKLQYLLLNSQLKKNKVFTPQANKVYMLYMDSVGAPNLVAELKTDQKGKAKAFIPPGLKSIWEGAAQHNFIVMEGNTEVLADFSINKAKLSVDTANNDGVRAIVATVQKLEGADWVPAADVELKVGIQRMGGLLSAGEEETYTTDSTGTISVDLVKKDLPGDAKGNYVIAVRVDDNETLGNLLIEKTVPWGKPTVANTGFFEQRTLWSTRFKAPYWLLFMACSIVIGVWGTLIYLVVQIVKIKKIGDGNKPEKVRVTEHVPSLGS